MTADTITRILNNADLPFTAGHMRWLSEGANVTKKAFHTIMTTMVDDFFKVDRSDGSGRLRASNFGKIDMTGIQPCDRMHVLSFLGIAKDPSDPGSVELMTTGTFLHYYYQLAGLSAGYLKDVEVKIEHTPWYLRGSMDGQFTDGSGLEIKTTGSQIFSSIDKAYKIRRDSGNAEPWRAAKKSHLWQVHMYMEATGIDQFSIVYIDRGYPSRFLELRVPYSADIVMEVNDVMSRLVNNIANETLPPMLDECTMLRGKTYETCDYRSMCPQVKGFQ